MLKMLGRFSAGFLNPKEILKRNVFKIRFNVSARNATYVVLAVL